MKRIQKFFIGLKPYKRKYKMVIMTIIIFACIFLQLLFGLLSLAVPHIHNAFWYVYKGFHRIVDLYGSETKAAAGFAMSSYILGLLPIIVIIPILYFTFANYLMFEVFSEKGRFIQIPAEKYKFWAFFVHAFILMCIFMTVPMITNSISGYRFWPYWYIAEGVVGLGSDSLMEKITGSFALLHIILGYTSSLVVIYKILYVFFKWLFGIIAIYWNKMKEALATKKMQKIEAKIQRKEQKINNKQK